MIHGLHEVLEPRGEYCKEDENSLEVDCMSVSFIHAAFANTHPESRPEPRIVVSSSSPFWYAILVEEVIADWRL